MLNHYLLLSRSVLGTADPDGLSILPTGAGLQQIGCFTCHGQARLLAQTPLSIIRASFSSQPEICQHLNASPRPRQPLFEVPALRELESACRVGILWDAVTLPTVCFFFMGFQGSPGGSAAVCDPKPSAATPEKSLGVHKILARKILVLPPPQKMAQNEGKLYKSVENPQN